MQRRQLEDDFDFRAGVHLVDTLYKDKRRILMIIKKSDEEERILYRNPYARSILGNSTKEISKLCSEILFDQNPLIDLIRSTPRMDRWEHRGLIRAVTGELMQIDFTVKKVEFSRSIYILEEKRTVKKEAAWQESIDKGERLRVIMSRLNINGRELSERTGISAITISKIRNGKIHNPHIHTLISISEALSVPINEIWE